MVEITEKESLEYLLGQLSRGGLSVDSSSRKPYSNKKVEKSGR